MADREDAHLIACWHETVERDVPRAPERDDQLSQLTRDDTADEGMIVQHLDRSAYRRGGPAYDIRIGAAEVVERAFEIRERVG